MQTWQKFPNVTTKYSALFDYFPSEIFTLCPKGDIQMHFHMMC